MIKLSVGVLVGVVLLVVLGWGGCHGYSHWQQRHLVRRAYGFMAGNDYRSAALCARRALQIGPYAAATRVMAEIGERMGDRTAVDWRRQALQLDGGRPPDALELVKTALHFNDLPAAESALTAVSEKGRDTAAYQAAAARVADAKHEQVEAEKHWQRALELDGANPGFQLEASISRLHSSEEATREAGRASLEKLRANGRERAPATRALIADDVANHRSAEKIVRLARDLQGYPERLFSDRLLYLDILRQVRAPDFTSYLTTIETDAAKNPPDLAALLSWMTGSDLVSLGLDYSRSLPEAKLKEWPVPLSLAEAYTKAMDWKGLERVVNSTGWGQFEFLRGAYLARLYRETRKTAAAEREWAAAKKSASAQAESLSSLIRLASDWKWNPEAIDLLWTLTKFPEKQKDALSALYQTYNRQLDSDGLYRVTSRLAEIDPSDLRLQNNLAQISLLLDVNADRARQSAKTVYRSDPKNPSYVSTYAFALFSQGKADEAVRLMEQLPTSELQKPEIGAYYGVFLAGAGKTESARYYLGLAASAQLLPEEKALVDQAKRRVGM